MDIPIHVKGQFSDFYHATVKQLAKGMPGVAFLEYAWGMAWFDLCAADPLFPCSIDQYSAHGGLPKLQGTAAEYDVREYD